jgi:protein involved in polysaccharide export with SLBB domain
MLLLPIRSLRAHRELAVLTFAALLSTSTLARAQLPHASHAAMATRVELETEAAQITAQISARTVSDAARQSLDEDALRIAHRLDEGDFAMGDRIILRLQGAESRTDTITVGSGQALPIAGIPDLQLRGVLRSELRDRLTEHVAKYIRNPQMSVVPLIRVSVLGAVSRPGYYGLPPESPISDAIMLAGGPTADADVGSTILRRGGQPLIAAREMRSLVAQGETVNALGVLPGDEVVVGQRGRHDPQVFFQGAALLLGVVSAYFAWSAVSSGHR